MLIFENEAHEIHDVGTNSKADPSLTAVEVTDGTFDGWSVAKICCYKADVIDGNVVSCTPYVDSRLIEHIDQLGEQAEAATPLKITKNAYIEDTEIIFDSVPEGNLSVFVKDTAGNYPGHTVQRESDRVTVTFDEPLESVAEVTIMIQ